MPFLREVVEDNPTRLVAEPEQTCRLRQVQRQSWHVSVGGEDQRLEVRPWWFGADSSSAHGAPLRE
jgi:hypothetical protein